MSRRCNRAAFARRTLHTKSLRSLTHHGLLARHSTKPASPLTASQRNASLSRMIAALIATLLACGFADPTRANECDEVIGRHMAGQAMLAAQFVASAEKVGMTAQQINAVLTDI